MDLLALILLSFFVLRVAPLQLHYFPSRIGSRTIGTTIDAPGLLSSPSFFPTPGSTTAESSSPVPSSKKTLKKNGTTKKKKKQTTTTTTTSDLEPRGNGVALTDDQLVDHVAGVYSTAGRRGGDEVTSRRTFVKTDDDERDQFLQTLSERHALVLNADYQPLSYLPLSRWSWQDAVTAVLSGKVTVVEVYDDVTIRTASMVIPLPSVIALNDYVHNRHQRPAFTRRNVYLRDEYRCAYCSGRFHTADLSLDHVHPRCMGGMLSWYVVVFVSFVSFLLHRIVLSLTRVRFQDP
jgi:hypothetical protein